MGIVVRPKYTIETGVPFVAADVEKIIDDATVDGITAADIGSTGDNVLDFPSTYTASGQLEVQRVNSEFRIAQATGASAPGVAFPFEGGLAWWDKQQGPAGTKVPGGWPVKISRTTVVDGWNDHILVGQWAIPQVQASVVYRNNYGNFNYNSAPRYTRVWDYYLITASEFTASPCLGPVVYRGMCDALVAQYESDSLVPGALYALKLDGGSSWAYPYQAEPVAWSGSHGSTVTWCHVPLGIIREVYTASGATAVVLPQEDSRYDPGTRPYYVAKVWFWGAPCL